MLAPEQGANCLQYRVDNAGQFAGLGTLTQTNQILVGQVPCHELVESTGISLSSRQATVVLPTPDSSNSVVVRLLQSSIRLHQFTFHTEELIHQHPNAFHCSFGLRMQSVTVEESQNGFEGGSMHQLVNHRFSGRVQGVDLLLTDVGEALDLTIHLTITSTNRTGVLDVLANVGSRADHHCVTLGSQGRHDITQHTVLSFRQLDGFGDITDVGGVELVDTRFMLGAEVDDLLGQSISCHRLIKQLGQFLCIEQVQVSNHLFLVVPSRNGISFVAFTEVRGGTGSHLVNRYLHTSHGTMACFNRHLSIVQIGQHVLHGFL